VLCLGGVKLNQAKLLKNYLVWTNVYEHKEKVCKIYYSLADLHPVH